MGSAIGEHPMNAMGYNSSVQIIGDVNGDGIDDILVGAHFEYTPNNGRISPLIRCGKPSCDDGAVYLIFGTDNWASRQNMKIDSMAYLIFKPSINTQYLGSRVCKGNLNGDGYMDIIFSGYGNKCGEPSPKVQADDSVQGIFQRGKVYVLKGRSTADWEIFKSLNHTTNTLINPTLSYKIINIDIGSIDPNGNEINFISDPDHSKQIFTSPDSAGFVSITGSHYQNLGTPHKYFDDELGSALACQKLNNDEYDDLIIGAMGNDMKYFPKYYFNYGTKLDSATATPEGKGCVYIILGGPNFFSKGINLPVHSNCDAYLLGNDQDCQTGVSKFNEGLGFSLTPVTNFESGVKGFAVGCQGNPWGYLYNRSVYYVRGSDIIWKQNNYNNPYNGLIENKASFIFKAPNDYPDTDLTRLHWNGITIGDFFGGSLATTDFNGDTYEDILIGNANYSSDLGYNTGRVDIFLGGRVTGGTPSNPVTIYTKHPKTDRWLNATDQPNIITYTGFPQNAIFGQNINSIGDLDGDGYSDFIAGMGLEKGVDTLQKYLSSRKRNADSRRDAMIIYGHPTENTIPRYMLRQFTLTNRLEQAYHLSSLMKLSNPYTPFVYLFDDNISPKNSYSYYSSQYPYVWDYTYFLGEESAHFKKIYPVDNYTSAASLVTGNGDINGDGVKDIIIVDDFYSKVKENVNEWIKADDSFSENVKDMMIGKIYFISGNYNSPAFQRKKYSNYKTFFDNNRPKFINKNYSLIQNDVNQIKSDLNKKADLWMRDYLKTFSEDRGFEGTLAYSDLYLSPDIWAVNNLNTSLQKQVTIPPCQCPYYHSNYDPHEQPIYKLNNDSTVKPVYIFVKVRNRGFEINDVFKEGLNHLHLYWTIQGTQGWYSSFVNYRIGGKLYGDSIHIRVNTDDPVNADSNLILVGPGEYQLYTFKFTPPDPSKYEKIFKTWDDNLHLCFLARITGPAIWGGSADGMTYAESKDVWSNVGFNNNIAWKNMAIRIAQKFRTTNGIFQWHPIDGVYCLNGLDEGGEYSFKIKASNKTFSEISQFGKAYLNIPRGIYNTCIMNNSMFNNLDIKVISDDTVNFEITSDSAWITKIILPPDSLSPFRFYFKPSDLFNSEKVERIEYDLLQEKQERPYPLGGARIVIILDPFIEPINEP
jgi:hypothetical protein